LAGYFFLADKPPADIRPVTVDGALPLGLKLAAVFDNQAVMAAEGKVETAGTKGFEGFKLGPGKVDCRKGSTAESIASLATRIVIYGMVQKDPKPCLPGAEEGKFF